MSLDPKNPFAAVSTLEYEMPPFALIKDEHYLPAFYGGMEEQLAEVDAIIAQPDVTFENTIVALEKSGRTLLRVTLVFFNKSSSDTSDLLDAIEEEIAPKLAAHSDAIRLNPLLWSRVVKIYNERSTLGLEPEDLRLVELYYKDFHFAGAHLNSEERVELKTLNEELSKLEAEFSRKVLADTNDSAIVVDSIAELSGLSDNEIAGAKAAAEARGLNDKYLIDAVNYSGNPALATLTNRDMRERIMQASLARSNRDNENDTKSVLVAMTKLRARRATLFGAKSHAEYITSENTAKSPENIHVMLRKIAKSAAANVKKEGEVLQEAINAAGEAFSLQSWDWDLYSELVRAEKYQVDTAALKPYFELEKTLWDGVFFAATKLFGVTFKERPDIVTYHPEARAFEVNNEDGSKLGLFIGDFYTRDSKRGGAWMNNLVDQNFLFGQLPVVVNNLNIVKPPEGEPTLLSFDFLTTLFHEFGHALHGLFSQAKYPRTSGTNVERDFVEFPSQVNEMWIFWPEVVNNFAVHYQTGEKLPQSIIDNIENSSTFNQGFETSSYLQAAILDLALHQIPDGYEIDDVVAFESKAIADYGLDYAPVPTRYRSTYFSHIFAGGYSSGYYGYIWSEILDADTVDWFKENGGLTRANGDHFRRELLGRGGTIDSMQMYRNFRGRDASIAPLLKRRGLN
ncbi:MAG: M3 family metallopeptidase [Actinomycetes bacterium]